MAAPPFFFFSLWLKWCVCVTDRRVGPRACFCCLDEMRWGQTGGVSLLCCRSCLVEDAEFNSFRAVRVAGFVGCVAIGATFGGWVQAGPFLQIRRVHGCSHVS